MQLKDYKSKVTKILQDRPETRNDDGLLESIRRVRQIIQNSKHELIPTNAIVRKARGIKEKNYRDCEIREAKLY